MIKISKTADWHQGNKPTEILVEGGKDFSDGCMVALVPAREYAEKMVVEGYEDLEEIHLTLLYLGKIDQWGVISRNVLTLFVLTQLFCAGKIKATINSCAIFNLSSDEPATVYLVGGEGAVDCRSFHDRILQEVMCGADYPEIPVDYPFYQPHITIGYGIDIDNLTYQGDIVFDRVRLAFGTDVIDIPLI